MSVGSGQCDCLLLVELVVLCRVLPVLAARQCMCGCHCVWFGHTFVGWSCRVVHTWSVCVVCVVVCIGRPTVDDL